MRVIAGSARGVRLLAPKGVSTRPTSDRVREALFSIITSSFDVKDVRALDICAGTGSLGIEAISRGAASCTFIEHDVSACVSLEKNISTARCPDKTDIIKLDAVKALRLLAGRGRQFEIAFFDPPYASELYIPVLEALAGFSLIVAGGLLVVESSSRNVLADHVGSFVKIDHRVYGDTALELYVQEEP